MFQININLKKVEKSIMEREKNINSSYNVLMRIKRNSNQWRRGRGTCYNRESWWRLMQVFFIKKKNLKKNLVEVRYVI